ALLHSFPTRRSSDLGARFGIKTSAFVRGEPVDNPVLGMCRLFGMKLRFVDRSAYREKKELFARHYDANQAYFLDEGGYGPSGARGCSELIMNSVNPTITSWWRPVQEQQLLVCSKVSGSSSYQHNYTWCRC